MLGVGSVRKKQGHEGTCPAAGGGTRLEMPLYTERSVWRLDLAFDVDRFESCHQSQATRLLSSLAIPQSLLQRNRRQDLSLHSFALCFGCRDVQVGKIALQRFDVDSQPRAFEESMGLRKIVETKLSLDEGQGKADIAVTRMRIADECSLQLEQA